MSEYIGTDVVPDQFPDLFLDPFPDLIRFWIRKSFQCGGARGICQYIRESTSGGGKDCAHLQSARQSQDSSAAAQPIATSARRDTSIYTSNEIHLDQSLSNSLRVYFSASGRYTRSVSRSDLFPDPLPDPILDLAVSDLILDPIPNSIRFQIHFLIRIRFLI
jgi:hypothetical protein